MNPNESVLQMLRNTGVVDIDKIYKDRTDEFSFIGLEQGDTFTRDQVLQLADELREMCGERAYPRPIIFLPAAPTEPTGDLDKGE